MIIYHLGKHTHKKKKRKKILKSYLNL